jgi:hypothetical protein
VQIGSIGAVAREQLCGQVLTPVTREHAEGKSRFQCSPCREYIAKKSVSSPLKEGLEYPVPGGITGPHFSCGIKLRRPGALSLSLGETQRMNALAVASSGCKRETRPLVREGTPHKNPSTDSNTNLVLDPR